MSTVVSFRLSEANLTRRRRAARAMGRSPGKVAAVLVEEGLRLREFPGIEFRDTPVGRQAFLRGTRLGIWQVAEVVSSYAGPAGPTEAEVTAATEHLGIPPVTPMVIVDDWSGGSHGSRPGAQSGRIDGRPSAIHRPQRSSPVSLPHPTAA